MVFQTSRYPMSCFVFPLHRNTFHNHLAFFPLQVPFSELLFRHVFYCSLCKFSLNPLCRQFLLEPVTQCRFSCQHEESPVNRLIVLSESGRERETDIEKERVNERRNSFKSFSKLSVIHLVWHVTDGKKTDTFFRRTNSSHVSFNFSVVACVSSSPESHPTIFVR